MNEDCSRRGHVTKFGYRRIRLPGERRLKMAHVLVWEEHHGPVPLGRELHHRNGDKLDNRIDNLQLVTRLEHKRIHSGCILCDDVWWKRCRKCLQSKPETDFYNYPGRNGLMGLCKRCCSRTAVEYKRKRRVRRRRMVETLPATERWRDDAGRRDAPECSEALGEGSD